jgi:hypothetical protein
MLRVPFDGEVNDDVVRNQTGRSRVVAVMAVVVSADRCIGLLRSLTGADLAGSSGVHRFM